MRPLDLVVMLGYGALGAAMFYPVIEGWRFLARQGGFQTDPLRRRDYAVIGALLALQYAVGKLLP
jgi:hypothetical protein